MAEGVSGRGNVVNIEAVYERPKVRMGSASEGERNRRKIMKRDHLVRVQEAERLWKVRMRSVRIRMRKGGRMRMKVRIRTKERLRVRIRENELG